MTQLCCSVCHCNRELKPFYMFTLLCTPLVYFSCIRKENKGVLIKMWATAFRYHWTCLSEVAEVQSGLMTLANLLSRCFVVLSTYIKRERLHLNMCAHQGQNSTWRPGQPSPSIPSIWPWYPSEYWCSPLHICLLLKSTWHGLMFKSSVINT